MIVTKRWLTAVKLVVKRTGWNQRYGVHCVNPDHPEYRRVFAGESGDIKRTYLSGPGWTQNVMMAEFSNGRTVHIAEEYLALNGKLFWRFRLGFDPLNFKLVKAL